MKYLSIFIIAFMGFSATAFSQNDAISRYFEKYMDDERFTVVYLSPKMFEILGKLDLDEMEDKEAADVMSVISDLKSLRVLTSEDNPRALYKEALSKINTSEYEVLMTVRDDDENVNFWIRDEGHIINELLLLVGGEDEFVLLSFVGNIDLKKISKLAKSVDVKGMDQLEKLEEKEH